MEIPPHLLHEIKEGKVVLLLGSGASREAVDSAGNRPPTTDQLSRMISQRFLDDKYIDYPLDQVGELAISESDLFSVQDYIREILDPFEPAEAHALMTTFQWEGLATTNYDRLIELAYAKTPNPAQIPQPFLEDGDRIHDKMRNPNSVKLLKLHGCITRTNSPSCPLILTVDQYTQYERGRKRLFDQLYDWARERSIIFIGHSLKDSDLRILLNRLITEAGDARPRYFTVTPVLDAIQSRFWESRKVTTLEASFGDFMKALDSSISTPYRRVKVDYSSTTHPIEERFVRHDSKLSDRCKQFLDVEVDYVRNCGRSGAVDAQQFYRGFDLGWGAIEQDLDIGRRLADEILTDLVLDEPAEAPPSPTVVLVNAHAGAGKTILLKRMAWDAAHDYNRLCLYLKAYGTLDPIALQELQDLSQERIFLFVDNAADHTRELRQIANANGPEFRRITVITAERTNEWNMVDEESKTLVSASYDLEYLTEREIDALLAKLRRNRALGTLAALSEQEQREAFKKRAGRQLLVALHEATLGKALEDIVVDEYQSISPVEAQRMYLSICVLNRLNVGVRAGIISRIHGIRFEDFQKRFFQPLENVVWARPDPIIRDYVYMARHPYIADIVFTNILKDQEERFDAYVRCLRALNLDYKDDASAFRQMIRAHSLLEMFPNPDLIRTVLQEAQAIAGKDAFVLQQVAIFEMHHATGDLARAEGLLRTAEEIAPYSASIKHSLAEVELGLADQAHTELQRENHLKRAETIAFSLTGRRAGDSHPYHTLCKVGIKRLEVALSRSEVDFSPVAIEEIVKEIERHLSVGLQRFPEDSYLLDAESRFASLMSESERALNALVRAFKANRRNAWFAIRISRVFQHRDDITRAAEVLKEALEANANNLQLHYAYAKLMLETGRSEGDELRYHLQRSFSPGDNNIDAQILYGRQLYRAGGWDEAKGIFAQLSQVKMSPESRNRRRYPLEGEFYGSVVRQEVTYCFIQRDGIGERVFVFNGDMDADVLNCLRRDSRVAFRIGFTMRGPRAFDVRLL